MAQLPAKPLQVMDFSGGIIDNFVPGSLKQYKTADNLLVTTEGHFITRDGSDFFDISAKRLPTNDRIDIILKFKDTIFAGSEGRLFRDVSSVWTELVGPTGNPTFGLGDRESVPNSTTWNNHLFITNDSGALPQKIYLDENGIFQVRTAGMPALDGVQVPDPGILLTNCIALANDLRVQLLAHIQDQGAVNVDQHRALDTVNEATLTASTPATNQATLFTLITALISAYDGHVADVIDGTATNPAAAGGDFHQNLLGKVGIPNIRTSTNTTPTTLKEAAARLDDLKQKYFWHTWATNTHDSNNDGTFIGQHQVFEPKIGEISSLPQIIPNRQDSFDYANDFKVQLNVHVAAGAGANDPHFVADTAHNTNVPDATDFDTWTILITHLRENYELHRVDADPVVVEYTGDTTIASVNIIDIKNKITSAVENPTVNQIVHTKSGALALWASPGFTTVAVVNSPGDIDTVATALATNNDAAFFGGDSDFHSDQDTDSGATLGSGSTFQKTGTDFFSWNTLMVEAGNAWNLHVVNTDLHRGVGDGFVSGIEVGAKGVNAPLFDPTVVSYLYSFYRFFSYTVGDILFEDNGPVAAVPVIIQTNPAFPIDTIHPTQRITQITQIPELFNGSTGNHDTATVKTKIFRTPNTGLTFFSLGEVTNGTTTFNDIVNDTLANPGELILTNRATIYTTGGVVSNTAPPSAKVMHVNGNIGYYGNIIDASNDAFPNRILQSIPNDIDSVPTTFFDDLDDDVTAISSIRNNTIACTTTGVYRMQGLINSLGIGVLTHERISDEVGCIGSASMVKTEQGLFFAGTDGFYYTDGYQVLKLNTAFDKTYQAHTQTADQKKRITGAYDELNKRIWWSVQTVPTDPDVNACFILDLNWGVKGNSVYTTASGGVQFPENFRPSALFFDAQDMLRGDTRGYLLVHNDSFSTDPKLNTEFDVAESFVQALTWQYTSSSQNFGTSFIRKWVTRINIVAKDKSNLSVQIDSINDDKNVTTLKPIRYRNHEFWGDPSMVWGTSPAVWSFGRRLIDEWRRFIRTSLRCDYKQITMKNATVNIANSDDASFGTMQVIADSPVQRILRLAFPGGFLWPPHVEDYIISTEEDNFVKEFTVIRNKLDVVNSVFRDMTVSDPNLDLSLLSDQKWILKGIPKFEKLELLGYVIHWNFLGKTQKDFSSAPADTGGLT